MRIPISTKWRRGGLVSIQPHRFRRLALQPDMDVVERAKSRTTRMSRARGCFAWKTPGMAPLPREYLAPLARALRSPRVVVHLDGAACTTPRCAGVSGRPLAGYFDSVSVACRKACAPVGSFCGPRAIDRGRAAAAQVACGGMTPGRHPSCGVLYALDPQVARLADDHARAARLEQRYGPCRLEVPGQHTNRCSSIAAGAPAGARQHRRCRLAPVVRRRMRRCCSCPASGRRRAGVQRTIDGFRSFGTKRWRLRPAAAPFCRRCRDKAA